MKKIYVLLLLGGWMATCAMAQDIYQEVKTMRENYKAIANDQSKSLEERKLATFKFDAIWYLETRANEETESELGLQVASMIDFIALFTQELKAAKNKKAQQQVIQKFKNASLENARYNDTDKELIYAYVDNKSFLTNFSLDTDWVRALEAVKQ